VTAVGVMSTIRAPRTSSPTPTIRPSTIASLRSGEYKIVPSAASNASGCSTASDLCRADDARAALREGGGAIAAAAAGAGSDLSGGVCSCLAAALVTGSCRVGGGAGRGGGAVAGAIGRADGSDRVAGGGAVRIAGDSARAADGAVRAAGAPACTVGVCGRGCSAWGAASARVLWGGAEDRAGGDAAADRGAS